MRAGLGGLTDALRAHLAELPKLLAAQREAAAAAAAAAGKGGHLFFCSSSPTVFVHSLRMQLPFVGRALNCSAKCIGQVSGVWKRSGNHCQ